MLVGRESERSTLDALLQSARGERSAALVLRGEPGIGKTALLEYAADSARDMTVLRCVGIEAEYVDRPVAGLRRPRRRLHRPDDARSGVMALLGRRAWWLPSRLGRLVPNVDIEGEKLLTGLNHAPART